VQTRFGVFNGTLISAAAYEGVYEHLKCGCAGDRNDGPPIAESEYKARRELGRERCEESDSQGVQCLEDEEDEEDEVCLLRKRCS
jgi:hypothetical protein